MLHKLALATSVETPTLLKEALPTYEEHMKGMAQSEAKQRDLMDLRGNKVQYTTGYEFDPATGRVDPVAKPDLANTRARMDPNKPTSLLAEKEIQKAHGDVSKSNLKKMKHTYLGGAKRLWGGKGFLGGKWRNRAGILGGTAALGLGIKAYLDSNKTPQPQLAPPEEPQAMEQRQMTPQYAQYAGYPKMGSDKYSPDAVTIPKPTSQPTVPALGPGVASTPKITSKDLGAPSSGGLLGSSSPGSNSGSSSSSSSTKQAEDPGVLPLLGAAAGGAGGWALGKKFLAPAMEAQNRKIEEKILRAQATLDSLKKATKAAPMGSAAAGAILLAALAALYAKKKDSPIKTAPREIRAYDPSGAGFAPQDYNPYGQFYG